MDGFPGADKEARPLRSWEKFQGRFSSLLMKHGEWALRRGRAEIALTDARRVLHVFEAKIADAGHVPEKLRKDYADALLLKARALAAGHSPCAIPAYLRARQWVSLEPEDVDFLANHFLNNVPRAFSAYPIYVDWYHLCDNPVEAERRIRRIAEICSDDDPDDILLDDRQSLNEYLAAQFPKWFWTLEHLANAHLLRGNLDAAHGYLAEWANRDAENPTPRCRERILAAQRHLRQGQLFEALAAYEAAMLCPLSLPSPSEGEGRERVDAAHQLLSAVRQATLAKPQIRRVQRAFEGFMSARQETEDVNLLAEYAAWLETVDESAVASVFHRILEIDPRHPFALLGLGEMMFRRGKWNYSLELLERYLDERPEDSRAISLAAMTAVRAEAFPRAIELFQAMPERAPEEDVLYAKALAAVGEFAAARECLAALEEQALLAETESRETEQLFAEVAIAIGDYEEAARRYAELIGKYPDDWELSYHLGRACMMREHWEEAIDAFTRVLQIQPVHLPSLNGRGLANYRLNRMDAATDDFHSSLLENPAQADTLYALSRCLMDSDADSARMFLTRAVELEPETESAWLALARIHEQTGDLESAKNAYRSALSCEFRVSSSESENAETRHSTLDTRNSMRNAVEARFAYLQIQTGQVDDARARLDELAAEEPSNAALLYALGYCDYRAGDIELAVRRWRQTLLHRDDPLLPGDLAWLHLRLADAAAQAGNRAEMSQHWNTALDLAPDTEEVPSSEFRVSSLRTDSSANSQLVTRNSKLQMERALTQRRLKEAVFRLLSGNGEGPSARDVQIAHDLMTDVLQHDPNNRNYRLVAAFSAAHTGDWQLAEDLIEQLAEDPAWGTLSNYFLAVCHWERNLPDSTLTILDPTCEWSAWEADAQTLRAQAFLSAGDAERTARELAMLRAGHPEACPPDTAIAALLSLQCWRNVYEFVLEIPFDERSDFARYAWGVAALMLRRETEGLDGLEKVSDDSEWHSQARTLRLVGYKRQALRGFHSLGWEEVVASLRQVLEMDEDDETVREWLERATDFAMMNDPNAKATLIERWQERLHRDPTRIRTLHQWAAYAYWDAQEVASCEFRVSSRPSDDASGNSQLVTRNSQLAIERWRVAMSLWGTLLNLEDYWAEWIQARLERHDPKTWANEDALEERRFQVSRTTTALRQKAMVALVSDMTDSLSRVPGTDDVLDDVVLDFLREFQTAALWREWLDGNPSLGESVLPYGRDLLEALGRLDDVRNILNTSARLLPTPLVERLFIYLSPMGSLLAAAETGRDSLALEQSRELFDHEDSTVRRMARMIFVIATRNMDAKDKDPYDGIEAVVTAAGCAREVADSRLMLELDWTGLLTRLSDTLVSEVEAAGNRPPQERISVATFGRDLLRRAYEETQVRSLIHPHVRLTLFQVRALITMSRKDRGGVSGEVFTEYDGAALELLHEALTLAPDHVTLQQEAAQLRLRRGLVAVEEGRMNEALVDFARAHELDPVSHRISTVYANFMMEQAMHMWMENRQESQREALSLGYRVLSANPTDARILSRCSRFLDLPENHPLRQTPEYRQLAMLFLRYANEREEV